MKGSLMPTEKKTPAKKSNEISNLKRTVRANSGNLTGIATEVMKHDEAISKINERLNELFPLLKKIKERMGL